MAAIENIPRVRAEQEATPKPDSNEMLSNAIYTGTRIQLELRSQIRILQGMSLSRPFDTLISNLVVCHTHKIASYQRLIDISTAFISALTEGPKPGVDYGKLSAEAAKIRAELDEIDHTVFQTAPLVFATLMDMKEDSKHHTSHLIITKAEREDLISSLNINFGPKLDEKDQNYMVGAASTLKVYLLKDFKCSDDPWE